MAKTPPIHYRVTNSKADNEVLKQRLECASEVIQYLRDMLIPFSAGPEDDGKREKPKATAG